MLRCKNLHLGYGIGGGIVGSQVLLILTSNKTESFTYISHNVVCPVHVAIYNTMVLKNIVENGLLGVKDAAVM